MKRIMLGIVVSFSIIVLTACSLGNSITPKDVVKDFLDKYKNQDNEVIDNLDDVIDEEYKGEYKERYKTLMINQYKNLDYKITDEVVDGNSAIVSVDITVYDYSNAIKDSNTYLSEHEEEFYKDTNENDTKKEIDNNKFLEYKLDLLEKVTDKKTYSIDFSLNKENDKWKLDSLSDTDIEKIHGIYEE